MTTPMPDFSALLAQAQQISEQMMQAQEGLADVRAEGTSGGGLVTATVDGRGDLVAVTIEPAAYDPDDPDALDTVADLVVAAVRDAKHQAEQAATERIGQVTGPEVGVDFSALESLLPPGLLGGPVPDEADSPDDPAEPSRNR